METRHPGTILNYISNDFFASNHFEDSEGDGVILKLSLVKEIVIVLTSGLNSCKVGIGFMF
jgi:hypothetical protein